MEKHISKRRIIPVALALLALVAASGVAYAYWTANGSGTGTGATAASVTNVTVVQTTVLVPMYPGDAAQTITGNLVNGNTGPVYITTVTASIASVTGGAGTCDATDFTLSPTQATVNAEIPVGTSVAVWTGPAIQFNNKPAVNQDGCKGATVHLAYSIP
jgi:hypothetical protein